MSLPVETSETTEFTPESWANIPNAPTFKFRTAGFDEQRKLEDQLRRKRIFNHGVADVRAAMIDGIRLNWSPDEAEAAEQLLHGYWEEADAAERDKTALEIEPARLASINSLEAKVARLHEPLAEMSADIVTFREFWPMVAISQLLNGWTGIDLPYRREGGFVPLETMDALSRKVRAYEAAQSGVDGVIPGLGFVQLSIHAIGLMDLTKDEEKNSSSPSPGETTPEPLGDGKATAEVTDRT